MQALRIMTLVQTIAIIHQKVTGHSGTHYLLLFKVVQKHHEKLLEAKITPHSNAEHYENVNLLSKG